MLSQHFNRMRMLLKKYLVTSESYSSKIWSFSLAVIIQHFASSATIINIEDRVGRTESLAFEGFKKYEVCCSASNLGYAYHKHEYGEENAQAN